MGSYWIPIGIAIFGIAAIIGLHYYGRWRMRLHTKGILDFSHNGFNAEPGEPRTIFEARRLEKKFDKEN